MVFFANDKKTFSFKNEHGDYKTWPFDKRFHLLLNIAVGGTWGGQKGVDDGICPASMIIEYVRVYKYNPTGVVATGNWKSFHGPEAFLVNNRLFVRSLHSATTTVRLFSVNGKFITEYSGPVLASGGGCTVSLPGGSYVAVVNDGVTLRTIMLSVVP